MSIAARTLACLVAGALCLPLQARAAPADRASAVDLGARSGVPRPGETVTGGHGILRCFQQGRLIHESSGQAPLANDAAVHTFSASDAPSSQVQVLDLHQGLCLLISPAPPRP